MARLTSIFASRERIYFDLFEAAATNLAAGGKLLDSMLEDFPDSRGLARDIKELENEGDRITEELVTRLNHTFVTPIDREDIIALATALDDVIDYTEEVADYLGLYRIEAPMQQALDLARVLRQACEQIAKAMPKLRDFGDMSAEVAEIHRLENEGDAITREAVASLFDTGIDPMVVIRWKDIFERLEAAVDATERAANTLANIAVKNR